jgi:hypothetical protein
MQAGGSRPPLSEHEDHTGRWAEAGLRDTAAGEADRPVELQRLRIGGAADVPSRVIALVSGKKSRAHVRELTFAKAAGRTGLLEFSEIRKLVSLDTAAT